MTHLFHLFQELAIWKQERFDFIKCKFKTGVAQSRTLVENLLLFYHLHFPLISFYYHIPAYFFVFT
jgi:hypothetical protein